MYKMSKIFAAFFSAVALVGALGGCGAQQSTTAQDASADTTTAESAETTETTESGESTDSEQAIQEVTDKMLDNTYQTVTIVQTNTIVSEDGDSVENKTTYKFDISGDDAKSSVVAEFEGEKVGYYLDGDNVVADYGDGDVYAGTISQFGLANHKYPSHAIAACGADLAQVGKSATNTSVITSGDQTIYTFTLDPQKYAEVNKAAAVTNEELNVTNITVAYVFESDNMLSSISYMEESDLGNTARVLRYSDYDATTVDAAPEATKTFKDFVTDARVTMAAIEAEADEAAAGQAATE